MVLDKPLSYYVYAVVDVTQEPPQILKVENTRKDARDFVTWHPGADALRVRRARLTLYHK